MKTTLNKIKEMEPYPDGWAKLLKSLNKTQADNELLDLMDILKSNGIRDTLWSLRCFDYLDYCLFLADVAESVLHIYEKSNNNSAPRKAIEAIRLYKQGKITKGALGKATSAAFAAYAASDAADAASDAASDAVSYAASAASADAAYAASDAVSYAAYAAASADAAYAASDAVSYAAYAAASADAAYAASADAAYAAADAARSKKWSDMEQLFVNHFGGES